MMDIINEIVSNKNCSCLSSKNKQEFFMPNCNK